MENRSFSLLGTADESGLGLTKQEDRCRRFDKRFRSSLTGLNQHPIKRFPASLPLSRSPWSILSDLARRRLLLLEVDGDGEEDSSRSTARMMSSRSGQCSSAHR